MDQATAEPAPLCTRHLGARRPARLSLLLPPRASHCLVPPPPGHPLPKKPDSPRPNSTPASTQAGPAAPAECRRRAAAAPPKPTNPSTTVELPPPPLFLTSPLLPGGKHFFLAPCLLVSSEDPETCLHLQLKVSPPSP
ncbi:hypothetical protein ABPG75_009144 [Micractinium tetrahymenae]